MPVGFIVFPIVFQLAEVAVSKRDVCCHFGADKPVKSGSGLVRLRWKDTQIRPGLKKIGKVFFSGGGLPCGC